QLGAAEGRVRGRRARRHGIARRERRFDRRRVEDRSVGGSVRWVRAGTERAHARALERAVDDRPFAVLTGGFAAGGRRALASADDELIPLGLIRRAARRVQLPDDTDVPAAARIADAIREIALKCEVHWLEGVRGD